MPVSEIYKTIFIHIPKTGGTSVEFALGMHGKKTDVGIHPYQNQRRNYHTLFGKGLQHLTAREIFYLLARRSKARNPANVFYLKIINWMKSIYTTPQIIYNTIRKEYYVFTIVRNPYDRLVSQMAWSEGKWVEGTQLETYIFKESAKRMFSLPPQRIPGRYKPQYTYIFANEYKLVDDVYYFEDYTAFSAQLNTRFNLNDEIPFRMRSYHGPWEEYYDGELMEMVSEYYHKDFELFGYDR